MSIQASSSVPMFSRCIQISPAVHDRDVNVNVNSIDIHYCQNIGQTRINELNITLEETHSHIHLDQNYQASSVGFPESWPTVSAVTISLCLGRITANMLSASESSLPRILPTSFQRLSALHTLSPLSPSSDFPFPILNLLLLVFLFPTFSCIHKDGNSSQSHRRRWWM